MKAAVFHGVKDVRFEEVDKPELDEGEALLRVRACGICGSDLHTYREGLFLGLGLPTETVAFWDTSSVERSPRSMATSRDSRWGTELLPQRWVRTPNT